MWKSIIKCFSFRFNYLKLNPFQPRSKLSCNLDITQSLRASDVSTKVSVSYDRKPQGIHQVARLRPNWTNKSVNTDLARAALGGNLCIKPG